MTNNDVRVYFNTQLGTLDIPNLSVEGTFKEYKANENFVRTKLYPNESVGGALGRSKSRLAGLFQADIFVSKVAGVSEANRIADIIVDAFPLGSALLSDTAVVIFGVWQEGLIEEQATNRLHIPVIIRYEAFT